MSNNPAKEISETVQEIVSMMVKLTCVVHLRGECIPCMHRRIEDVMYAKAKELFPGEGADLKEEYPQFLRQMVIWAKEWTEAQMETPCSMEGVDLDEMPVGGGLSLGDVLDKLGLTVVGVAIDSEFNEEED